MPLESIRVSSPLPVPAERVYEAWLDTLEHSRMTGSPATVEADVGGRHSAWDGYIEGEILELGPGLRIVQTWRSSEFPVGHPDSRLEIRFRDVPGGCEIFLSHTEIPEGQGESYEKGWHEHYFIPMTKYFRETPEAPTRKVEVPVIPKKRAEKKAPAKKKAAKAPAKPKLAAKAKKMGKAKAKKAAKPARGKSGKAAKKKKDPKAPKRGAKKKPK